GFLICAVQLNFQILAYVHGAHAGITHLRERILDSFALRIEDCALGCNNNFGFHRKTEWHPLPRRHDGSTEVQMRENFSPAEYFGRRTAGKLLIGATGRIQHQAITSKAFEPGTSTARSGSFES